MEGNLYLIIIIIVIVFRLLGALNRKGRGRQAGRQAAGLPVARGPLPDSSAPDDSPQRIDPWAFESKEAVFEKSEPVTTYSAPAAVEDFYRPGIPAQDQARDRYRAGKRQYGAGLRESGSIDLWGFDRGQAETAGGAASEAATGEAGSTGGEARTEPEYTEPPTVRTGRPASADINLKQLLSQKDSFLTAFIFHQILEPPLRRRNR